MRNPLIQMGVDVARLTREIAHVAASLWLGFMLTAILHVRVPLHDPGLVWLGTAAAVWVLTHRPAAEYAHQIEEAEQG